MKKKMLYGQILFLDMLNIVCPCESKLREQRNRVT